MPDPADSPRPKRKESNHTRTPGVHILEPSGTNTTRRLRWKDPDDPDPNPNHRSTRPLTPAEDATEDTRAEARVKKFKEIEAREYAQSLGAQKYTTGDNDLRETFAKYFVTKVEKAGDAVGPAATLADSTVGLHRSAVDNLLAWCELQSPAVDRNRLLTKEQLKRYGTAIWGRPKKIQVKGTGGEWEDSSDPLSTHSINRDLRSLRKVLRWLSDTGFLRLTRDDISIALVQRAALTDKTPLMPAEIAALFTAADAHDAATLKPDRRRRNAADKHKPIRPVIEFVLFGGVRIQEVWVRSQTILTGPNRNILIGSDVRPTQINVPASVGKKNNKPGKKRSIILRVSSTLIAMAPTLMARQKEPLFDFTKDELDDARLRLIEDYGAPDFTWRKLRKTCSTYQVCAKQIWGAAAQKMVSEQLGHDEEVNEEYYSSVLEIPPEATTLEQAMHLEPVQTNNALEQEHSRLAAENDALKAKIEALTAAVTALATR